MKKVLIVLIGLFGVLFLLTRYGSQVPVQPLPADTLIVFSKQGCSHCQQAMKFLSTDFRASHPQIKIQILDVAKRENLTQLWTLVRKYRLNPDRVGTPFIVWNDRYWIGWGPDTGAEISSQIDRHQ